MRFIDIFRRLKRADVGSTTPQSRPEMWDLTQSRDGYVREKALRELCNSPTAEDWPYVLERLSDWVPQVRKMAMRSAHILLKEGHVATLRQWPKELSALARKTRTDSDRALSSIILEMAGHGVLAEIWPKLGRDFRETAVRVLLKHDRTSDLLSRRRLSELDHLSIQLILQEIGPSVDNFPTDLHAHPDPRTREAALYTAQDQVDDLKSALFDKSSCVRTTAQFLLAKLGGDARSIYLSSAQPYAIEGLCEVATIDDSELLRRLFETSRSRQRYAIARAMVRLGDCDLIEKMLMDTSGKVRRLGLGLALQHPGLAAVEMRQALFQSPHPGVRLAGALLLMNQSRWESLIQILKLIGNEEEAIGKLAREQLAKWLRWAETSPSVPDAHAFKRAIAMTLYMEARLPEDLKGKLKKFLSWTEGRVKSG